MHSQERMNLALAYLEEHLDQEIDLDQVARIALCSEYHFQRVFSFLAGITLSEYIRRRRLTRAALDLQRGARVTEVALTYGYSSPDAFRRAFVAKHGRTPSQARRSGQSLQSYPPLTFQLIL